MFLLYKSFQWTPTCCPCSCHRCPAHSCPAKCSPDNCHPACVQTWETMRHLQFVWSFYGNLDREVMIENDIMELWGTYSYCTYLQTHPKKPKYVDQHGRLWGRNSGKPIWSNNSCKVGSLLFQINDAVLVTLLVPSYNTCLVLPLCERVPYESPTKVIPNILAFR